ncbi:PKD-like domain-containing protein, partial [Pedobacter cryoconitis]
ATNLTNAAVVSKITVTPVSAVGCAGLPLTFKITVKPTSNVAAITDKVYCNTDPVPVLTLGGNISGDTYNWTNDNTAIGLAASGTGTLPEFTATNSTNAAVVANIKVTPVSTVGCAGTPMTFKITVKPTSNVAAVSDVTYCNGTTTTGITLTGNITSDTYNWSNDNTAIGLAASGTGIIPSFTATNSSNAAVEATITLTPVSTVGCAGLAKTFKITVKPTSNVAAVSDVTYCNGATTAGITLTGNITGDTYTWSNDNATIGLASSGTGTIPSFTATNSTNAPVVANIRVTPVSTIGCAGLAMTFKITVNPTVSLALTSNPGSNIVSTCINTPVSPIIYTISNGTGATVSNLPAGVTGNYVNGIFTINGIPTVSGTYPYTVTTTGGCGSKQLFGQIDVYPDATMELVSATGSNNPVLCINTPLNPITYKITHATGATTSGLPAGLTGHYDPATNQFIINGNPSVAGLFPYTITTTGGCSSVTLSGTIQVNPNTTIQLISALSTANQTLCINSNLQNIIYQTTNATNAQVTGLPLGITGTFSNGQFTINGVPAQAGTFNYTVTATGLCQAQQLTGTITVIPSPIGFNDLINDLSCTNKSIQYDLQANVNNVTKGGNAVPASFIWTAGQNNNVTGQRNGSGNTINATLINISHAVQQVIYTVTPTSVSGGCPGTPFTITVNVPVCSGLSIAKRADVTIVSAVGDVINYMITVKNTATANHTNVEVNDPFLGGILTGPISGDNGNGILEANETWIYAGTYRVTQEDLDKNGKPNSGSGKIINTVTLRTAEDPTLLTANATVDIVTKGSIVLVKTGVVSSDFTTITYTFKVRNTGKVRLKNLNLTDTKIIGKIDLGITVLEAGATISVDAVYKITDEERRDGRVVNTATVSGYTPAGDPVTDISGTQTNNDDPTVHIIVDAPQAINDRASVMINQVVTFSLTDNDIPSTNGLDKGSIVVTRLPAHGQVQIHSDGTVTYTPDRGYAGPDDFTYSVADNKGNISNKALVNITVIPIDLFIPNTITPNGDGKNDTFKIIGRESFDSIDLLIFNRWGNEVYRNSNYLDEWGGSGLAEGTYYYVMQLKKAGSQITKKGWILIKR